MKDCTKEFLLFSYFGLETSDIEDNKKLDDCTLITKCAQRAYLDLNRTLTFCDSAKGDDKKQIEKRVEFRDAICEIIICGICNFLNSKSRRGFYEWHNCLCENIRKTAENYPRGSDTILIISKNANEKFSYGQAQKWLNMTIKYMWLLGRWDDKFKDFIDVIHVPVDSYIIDAAWEYRNVKLPLKDEKNDRCYPYKTPSEYVKSWSTWEYEEYLNFQISLRTALEEENKIPIKWEGPAWIEIAKKRNRKSDNKSDKI